ncbi:hypothetical protein GCM10027417_17440 [Glutamicibacter endophyticus]
MGTIYQTTMTPSKNELLTRWLPQQDFYRGQGQPRLVDAGGFRLEDPAGKVGLEFRIMADRRSEGETIYALPMSYREAPLDGAEASLIGTSEHGVLGTRYIYDAAGDPLWHRVVADLVAGRCVPQHQQESDTEEPRVRLVSVSGAERTGQICRVLSSAPVTGAYVEGFWYDASGRERRGALLSLS